MYGSEIWGVFDDNKLKQKNDSYFTKLCNDFIAEKLHTKVCKYVLEVSRHSTNLAVMGELGRYPLMLEVLLNMIKYFVRLSGLQNCLAAEAFNVSRELYEKNKKSWYSCIIQLFEYFKIDRSKVICYKTTLKRYINKILCYKYKELWLKMLFNDQRNTTAGNKLRTYRLFKNNFNIEDYLNWGSYSQRRLITKFRISSHKLEIERGRYLNIPPNNRFCKLCKDQVEDEIHFLLECNKLETARKEIINTIENRYKNLSSLSNASKFIWIMSAEDNFLYNQLYLLLDKLFTLRDSLLQSI